MKWLAECSAVALREALRAVAPELSGCSITIPELVGKDDPLWWSSSAVASFLAALHQPATRERAEAAVGELSRAQLPPATTRTLRDRFGTWIRPDQRRTIMDWCDWADAALDQPAPTVLVHGELRLVADFETVAAAEPEYDLRTLPGTGPGVELLTAVLRHYQQLTGRQLSAERVMAWHLRTALGDALWRSEASIPLPDHRTPTAWVDDLSARFSALGIDPEARR